MGSIGILNVGAGDTKLTFDKANPAELIRSGRIVTDMLRRGYALLIEIPDGNGGVTYARVHEFQADVSEYIIADFDPITAALKDDAENAKSQEVETTAPSGAGDEARREKLEPKAKRGIKAGYRAVDASTTSGLAVARSAGG